MLSRCHLPALAHIAPLAVFMLINLLPGWLRVENSESPWYQRAPEHWIYPLQTLLCGGLLLAFRTQYRLAPWRGLRLGAVLGLAGCAIWVAPAAVFDWVTARGIPFPPEMKWLGVTARAEGFDPTVLAQWPGWQAGAIWMRFARMVLVVPLVEELFWRGFLMRFLAAEERPWQAVPFGTHRWQVFGIVTLLVMLAHNLEDYFGAFIWGALVYWVTVRTRSLGACVVMHAVCNLALGLYVMWTGKWGFW